MLLPALDFEPGLLGYMIEKDLVDVFGELRSLIVVEDIEESRLLWQSPWGSPRLPESRSSTGSESTSVPSGSLVG